MGICAATTSSNVSIPTRIETIGSNSRQIAVQNQVQAFPILQTSGTQERKTENPAVLNCTAKFALAPQSKLYNPAYSTPRLSSRFSTKYSLERDHETSGALSSSNCSLPKQVYLLEADHIIYKVPLLADPFESSSIMNRRKNSSGSASTLDTSAGTSPLSIASKHISHFPSSS